MIAEILAKYGLKLLFLVGALSLIIGFLSNIYDGIYDKGAADERVKWQQKEAQATEERDKKIKELTAEVKALEKAYSEKFAKIEADHKKEIDDGNAQKQRDIASARAGALKLRWPAKAESGSGRNATGSDTAAARVNNDSTKGELPREITANLYSLVDDADRNTKQLSKCQEVVEEYSKFRCTPYKDSE